MNKTLAKLNDFVDWFLPPAIAADREVRKQARMFLYSHLFGPFIGNTVPLAFYLLTPKPGADIAILAASITRILDISFRSARHRTLQSF